MGASCLQMNYLFSGAQKVLELPGTLELGPNQPLPGLATTTRGAL